MFTFLIFKRFDRYFKRHSIIVNFKLIYCRDASLRPENENLFMKCQIDSLLSFFVFIFNFVFELFIFKQTEK